MVADNDDGYTPLIMNCWR